MVLVGERVADSFCIFWSAKRLDAKTNYRPILLNDDDDDDMSKTWQITFWGATKHRMTLSLDHDRSGGRGEVVYVGLGSFHLSRDRWSFGASKEQAPWMERKLWTLGEKSRLTQLPYLAPVLAVLLGHPVTAKGSTQCEDSILQGFLPPLSFVLRAMITNLHKQ